MQLSYYNRKQAEQRQNKNDDDTSREKAKVPFFSSSGRGKLASTAYSVNPRACSASRYDRQAELNERGTFGQAEKRNERDLRFWISIILAANAVDI